MKFRSDLSQYWFLFSVKVPVYHATDEGKRVYDKRQACYFCGDLIIKIARHYEKAHSDEIRIQKILGASDKDERKKELERIRNMGNFNHNLKILQKGEGTLIISRRPKSTRMADEYLPCMHCFAFIHEDEMWRHTKHCIFNPNQGQEGDAMVDGDDELDTEIRGIKGQDEGDKRATSKKIQCRMFLEGASHADESMGDDHFALSEAVISRMRHGPVRSLVEKDKLILKFGSILLNKIGSKKDRKSVV